MARKNLQETGTESLEKLIPAYVANKSEMESYKEIVDAENALIKKLMAESGVDNYTTGGYTAKVTTSTREKMNEEKLLALLREKNIPGVIKTKEYVDMDALESYLYNTIIDTDFADKLAKCKEVSYVVQLRVGKEKKKKVEDD